MTNSYAGERIGRAGRQRLQIEGELREKGKKKRAQSEDDIRGLLSSYTASHRERRKVRYT